MNKTKSIVFHVFLIGLNLFCAFIAIFSTFCGMVGSSKDITPGCEVLMDMLTPFLILEAVVFFFLVRNIYLISKSNPRALKFRGMSVLILAMLIPVLFASFI